MPKKLPEEEIKRRKEAQKKAWKLANPGYAARWYAANRERVIAKVMERHRANPQATLARVAKYQAANPELCRERVKRWGEANPEKLRIYTANYRARKHRAIPPWVDLEAISSFYEEAAKKNLHVDHIVPLKGRTVCGLHVLNNLQMLTKSENSKKHNRLLEE
jgi:hypothetical protein